MVARLLSIPPKIKVLEALSALADGRVKILREEEPIVAVIRSSDGSREYHVVIEGDRVYSDDNGTKLRGYVGYPIIATLMKVGKLPRDPNLELYFMGIQWRVLNETYKKYSVVMQHVLKRLKKQGLRLSDLFSYVDKVLASVSNLRLKYDENLKQVLSSYLGSSEHQHQVSS